jgi:hypothetical protein
MVDELMIVIRGQNSGSMRGVDFPKINRLSTQVSDQFSIAIPPGALNFKPPKDFVSPF